MDALYTALVALKYPMEDPALRGNSKGEIVNNSIQYNSIQFNLVA